MHKLVIWRVIRGGALSVAWLVLALLGLAQAPAWAEETRIEKVSDGPEAVVDAFLMGVSQTQGQAELREIVATTFEMGAMSQAIVGRLTWMRWDEDERSAFAETLTDFIAATIARRSSDGKEQPTQIIATTDGPGGSRVVETRSLYNGEMIRIDYRLVEKEERWAIVDIVADAKVSEVARRRAEFSGIIRSEGHAGIIAALNAKISEMGRQGA